MQALRLRIPGEYWDSLLYDGLLVLICRDGRVEVADWDRLIGSLPEFKDSENKAMAHAVLMRGQQWYSSQVKNLFGNQSISNLVKGTLAKLSSAPIDVSRKSLRSATVFTMDLPSFPTTDIECFKSVLFCGTSEGLFESNRLQSVKSRDWWMTKSNDIPIASVAASYGTVAVAAGAEGLFERPATSDDAWYFEDNGGLGGFTQVSRRRASICTWAQFDLVSDDLLHGGYVTMFSRPDGSGTGRRAWRETDRTPVGEVDDRTLFGVREGLLRGGSKTLLLTGREGTYLRPWEPYKRQDAMSQGEIIEPARATNIEAEDPPRPLQPVDAQIANFGIIYEYDSSLVVESISGERATLRGEPVQWRVFPRSQRYSNQLTICRSNYLDVYAFWEQYFLDSSQRRFGLPVPVARA